MRFYVVPCILASIASCGDPFTVWQPSDYLADGLPPRDGESAPDDGSLGRGGDSGLDGGGGDWKDGGKADAGQDLDGAGADARRGHDDGGLEDATADDAPVSCSVPLPTGCGDGSAPDQWYWSADGGACSAEPTPAVCLACGSYTCECVYTYTVPCPYPLACYAEGGVVQFVCGGP